MYRFRKVEHLLGDFQELEKQEIYFAPPVDLNDPMEGFRDIFWKGDEIVWSNLLINYAKSVEHIFGMFLLLGDTKKIDENDLLDIRQIISPKTELKRNLTTDITQRIFAYSLIANLPKGLAARKNAVRRNELKMYLKVIHGFIVNAVADAYNQIGLDNASGLKMRIDEFPDLPETYKSLPAVIDALEIQQSNWNVEKMFSMVSLYSERVLLTNRYQNKDTVARKNMEFLYAEFPGRFVEKLETSMYPKWYSASFLSECTNSAIWAHYGDCHKGVCLRFKTGIEGDKQTLRLNTEYSWNSEGGHSKMIAHPFQKIIYTNKYQEIDFFRSLGMMTKNELFKAWYKNETGEISNCAEHLNKENEPQWQDGYWANFIKSISIKLDEWNFENEYRLIIDNHFVEYENVEKRKLQYDFNDLEAIIFGIKTSYDDKLAIMKIVDRKCRENQRTSFDFYQSYYATDTGKIEIFKLDLLDMENKTDN